MMAAVSSPSHSSSHLGKNTTLPKWKVDYHQAKPFLDKIEHLCLADGVDRSVWPRLLLKAIPNVHESSWVVNNIVTPSVDWAQARALFTSHFEMHAYEAVLKKEYATCKQLHRETVQVYADRFMELVTQLGYEDDNELVIDHYLAGLTARNNADFLRTLGTMRLMKNDNSFVFSSLKAVIDLTLSLERIDRVSNGVTPSSLSPSASSSNPSSARPSKSCVHHPNSTTHDTADCQLGARLSKSGSATSSLSSSSPNTSSSPPPNGGQSASHTRRGVKCY